MSVDVTNPDAVPVRARRRSRGAPSATYSPAPPTLLRVPDIRPLSRVVAADGGGSSINLVVATAPPVNEAGAANLGEERTEITTPHDQKETQASIDAVGRERNSNALADISILAKMQGKTIDALSRFGKKWSSQLGTWGAIAAAVIACTLVAFAMKQDDFDATPLPERMAMSEGTAGGEDSGSKSIDVTNLDASDDRIALDTSTNAAGSNTESISGVSHLTQGDVYADGFYANSRPFVGATGPTQNHQHPSVPRHAALASTPPSDSPQPGVAFDIMDPRPTYQQPWASSPPEPQSGYAQDQPLPRSPLGGSVAPPDVSELVPNVTPIDPSEVWPTPIVSDNEHAQIQTSTPYMAQYSGSRVASSPQSPSGYPTTDQSRYGSFSDLKRALIERKREREPHVHISDSRQLMPTRIPSGGAGSLDMEAVYNRSGVYR